MHYYADEAHTDPELAILINLKIETLRFSCQRDGPGAVLSIPKHGLIPGILRARQVGLPKTQRPITCR